MTHIAKTLLRRLRKWSEYHDEVTIYDAHQHLLSRPALTAERNSVRDITCCGPEIASFLIYTCGFKRTRKVRTINGNPYMIFVSSRMHSNYAEALTSYFHRAIYRPARTPWEEGVNAAFVDHMFDGRFIRADDPYGPCTDEGVKFYKGYDEYFEDRPGAKKKGA